MLGIDLSKWNRVINPSLVAKEVDFVLLRTGFSQTADTKFKWFVDEFKKVNVPILGVYHFSYATCVAEAVAEAQTAVELMKQAGLEDNVLVFFDFEYDSVTYARNEGVDVTKTFVTTVTKAFCDEVRRLGYLPGVYLNIDFKLNWYEKGSLDSYPLWIADWRKGQVHDDVLFHQYSAEGTVAGISGPVDMNHCYPTHFPNNPVEPPVDPADPITMLAKEVIAGKWGNGEARKSAILSAIQAKVNELLKASE